MPRSDDDLIARILEDEETSKIADALGIDPADYAARVLHYVKNPTAQAQLSVMSPEQERAAGVPTMAESLGFLDKLASGEIPLDAEHETTRYAGFDDDEKSSAAATGNTEKRKAPKQRETSTAGSPAPVAPRRGLKK